MKTFLFFALLAMANGSLVYVGLSHWMTQPESRFGLTVLFLLIPPLIVTRRSGSWKRWFQRTRKAIAGYQLLLGLIFLLLWYQGWWPGKEAHSEPVGGEVAQATPEADIKATATPVAILTPVAIVTPVAKATPVAIVTPVPKATPVAIVSPVVEATPMRVENFERGAPRPLDYSLIDRHALAAPPEVESDVAKLAAYLVRPARSDQEKVRALFRWTADRIAYDSATIRAGGHPGEKVEDTLRRRLAVCAGYARLMEVLGEKAGLDIKYVRGKTRGYNPLETDPRGHAWNSVLLPEGWCLMDATWAAGSVDDAGVFKKRFDEGYFLARPSEMINSHFPDDERWQMLDTPLSHAQFLDRPRYTPHFYRVNVQLPKNLGARWTQSQMTLMVDPKLEVSATLSRESTEIKHRSVLVERRGEEVELSLRPPEAGDYKLRIFAGNDQGEGVPCVVEMEYQAAQGFPLGFPETFGDFSRLQCRLIEPRVDGLKAGKQRFEIEVPGATRVYVGSWEAPLERKGQVFSGEITVNPGDLRVFVEQSPRNPVLVEYQVQ